MDMLCAKNGGPQSRLRNPPHLILPTARGGKVNPSHNKAREKFDENLHFQRPISTPTRDLISHEIDAIYFIRVPR